MMKELKKKIKKPELRKVSQDEIKDSSAPDFSGYAGERFEKEQIEKSHEQFDKLMDEKKLQEQKKNLSKVKNDDKKYRDAPNTKMYEDQTKELGHGKVKD